MPKRKIPSQEESDESYLKLTEKISELADNIAEEYDLMEFVEDSIKDVFACSLDCAKCRKADMGKCMQGFKKANLYWLRKIVQDEKLLVKVLEEMGDLFNLLSEYAKEIEKQRRDLEGNPEKKKSFLKKMKENKDDQASLYT